MKRLHRQIGFQWSQRPRPGPSVPSASIRLHTQGLRRYFAPYFALSPASSVRRRYAGMQPPQWILCSRLTRSLNDLSVDWPYHGMDTIIKHIESIASCTGMSLNDRDWHTKVGIPAEPGWYFIRTTAPVDVLKQQVPWAKTYVKKKTGIEASVANYDIAKRASRYADDLKSYWNTSEVYSGMASNLLNRAREHTFADPGTAGLALSRYEVLKLYDWVFGFVTLKRFASPVSCPDMLLKLGEQVWRARFGWPLLSSA